MSKLGSFRDSSSWGVGNLEWVGDDRVGIEEGWERRSCTVAVIKFGVNERVCDSASSGKV